MKTSFKVLLTSLILMAFSGCALEQPKPDLPIHWGTIADAKPSYRTEMRTSAGATAAGGVAGGVLGHQMGKGDGKKVMTGLGAILGAATANAASQKEVLVPTTAVIITDDESKEAYHLMVDGQWRVGMKVRFSVVQSANGDYQVIIR